MRPPNIALAREQLDRPKDEFHEVIVAIFGEYLMWCREKALENIRHLVESEEAREKLARVLREPFERASSNFSKEDKEVAEELQSRAVANFGKLLLTLLSGTGFDQTLGPDFVARFRLVMEICDSKNGTVIDEVVLNRGGEKFFPEYWAKWLNDHSKQRRP